MVVFKTGFLCYSCGSGVDWPADLCSAAGRACFESAFPVLCSGIFWADCCADSNYCEVSSYVNSYFLFSCFQFLCPLLVVGCCWLLVDSLVLEIVLISAIFILWWWLSILKGFFLLLLFCWTMWGSVRLLLFDYVVRGFSDGCALVSSEFYCGWWLW